jgi:hypothetical protein
MGLSAVRPSSSVVRGSDKTSEEEEKSGNGGLRQLQRLRRLCGLWQKRGENILRVRQPAGRMIDLMFVIVISCQNRYNDTGCRCILTP